MNKVSIVTISYNAKFEIERTINSVLNQTYEDKEYIIIDGKSTDGTLDIVKKYKTKISSIISEPDTGIYNAMNKSLDYCHGDWVIFMNAGDSFVDDFVLENIFKNKNYENVSVIFGFTLSDKGVMQLNPFVEKHHNSLQMGFCHQSSLIRLDVIQKYRFDENYKIAADYNLMYRVWKDDYKFQNSGVLIAQFDTNGISSNRQLALLEEVAKFTHLKGSVPYFIFKLKLMIKYLLQKL